MDGCPITDDRRDRVQGKGLDLALDAMSSNSDPVESAWRIHSAQVDWTGKVDSKASFALAIQSAVMAGIIGLAGGNRRLANLEGFWANTFFWVGMGVLILSVVAVTFVVRPRLRSRKLGAEIPDNFIFFGHLRKWSPQDLEKALVERELLPVLTRQIVEMSKVTWQKHRLLQVSMTGALIGTAFVAIAGVIK